MKKFYSILSAFLIGISVYAQKEALILSTPLVEVEYQVTSLSRNGKWACGIINDGNTRGFIWDLSTGKVTELSSMGEESIAMGVSNDGTVVGTFSDLNISPNGAPVEAAGYWSNGSWHHINHTMKDGTDISESIAFCISPNGQHIGGIAKVGSYYQPVSWTGGEITVYPCDENNPGGAIYDISDDGSLASGWSYIPIRTFYNRGTTYWKNGVRNVIDPTNASPFNVANKLSPDFNKILAYDRILNVSTGETSKFDLSNVFGFEVFDITNDGKAIGYSSADMYSSGSAIIIINGKIQDLKEYLTDKGADLSDYQLVRGIMTSADENTFAVIAYDKLSIPRSLVIKLNENITTPAPVALTATQLEGLTAVKLSWEAPLANAAAVTGYNIYRNGTKMNTAPVTEKKYLDRGLSKSEYEYTVKAVYEAGESEASIPAVVTVGDKELSAPRNMVAMQSGRNNVRLLWDAPSCNLPVLSYTKNTDKVLGFGGGTYSFESAVRYDAAELEAYKSAGYKITDIAFYPVTRQNSWTISFYEEGNMTPFYTETIEGDKLQNGMENHVTLASPVEIPAGKDLLMGITVDVTNFGGYNVMGMVYGNCKAGYTDLLRQKGEANFYSLYETALQSENGAYEFSLSWAMGIYLSSGKENDTVNEYKVYANGAETSSTTGNSFMQKGVANGTYRYEIAAIYADGRVSEKAACDLTVKENTSIYKPVSVINTQINGTELTATWEAPVDDDEQSITHALGLNTGGVVGSESNQYSYMISSVYTSEKLRAFDGYQIKGFRFYPLTDADFTFILKENGQEIAELPVVRGEGYTVGQWNTVYLDEPITLNRFSEYDLILDCYDVTPEQAPVGMDGLAAYPYVSDLYSTDGGENFSSLSTNGGKNGNWMIGLLAGAPEGDELPVVGYNVSIDGMKKNIIPLTDTKYTTTIATEGTHRLNVNVVYEDPIGEKTGSPVFFNIDLTGIQNIQNTPFSVTVGQGATYVKVSGSDTVESITAYSTSGAKAAYAESNTLDISNLTPGIYVLKIAADGKVVSAKISVNR